MNFRQRTRHPSGRQTTPCLLIATLALGLLGSQLTARAGVALGLPATISGNDAVWESVENDSGTSNGDPVGGATDDSPGLGVDDAHLVSTGQDDAFDQGMTLWVNNDIYVAPPGPTVTPSLVATDPVPMSGLNVSVEYYALTSSPTLRMQGIFQNPGTSPVTVTVTLATNLGSDGGTTIVGTSSGDTTFTAADRWIVTDDTSDDTFSDPTVTHFLSGAGALQPSSVSNTVFNDSGTQGVLANYQLTVPGLTTRRLLFFAQLSSTKAIGLTNAQEFDDSLDSGSEALTGIGETEQDQIVNFDVNAADEGGALRVWGSGVALLGRARATLSVSAHRLGSGQAGGNLTYTEPQRSIRGYQVTGITRQGNVISITGLARFTGGTSRSGPFTATIVDNGGSGDQFSLSGGGINVGPLALRGNIRVQP